MRRRRRSAVSPWNVDPLRSTTLRGIRSARSGLGQRSFRSSALNRKSCHASVSVMSEKRGRCCPQMDRYESYLPDAAHDSRNQRRVVSLCVEPPLRVRPTPPAAGSANYSTYGLPGTRYPTRTKPAPLAIQRREQRRSIARENIWHQKQQQTAQTKKKKKEEKMPGEMYGPIVLFILMLKQLQLLLSRQHFPD